jgi:hypothetical protein
MEVNIYMAAGIFTAASILDDFVFELGDMRGVLKYIRIAIIGLVLAMYSNGKIPYIASLPTPF